MRGLTFKVAEREVGTIPVSIPTAMILESLRDLKETKCDHLVVNVATLLRNLLGSIEYDYQKRVEAEDLVPTLKVEMELISNLVSSWHGGMKVIFYYATNSDLFRKLPNAILREAKTPIQQHAAFVDQSTLELLVQNHGKEFNIVTCKTDISVGTIRAYMLTHSPMDLHFNSCSRVILAESHTGAFYPKGMCSRKLTNGRELPELPFNEFTLQVFGDNNCLLSQMPRKIRLAVLEIAKANRWSAITDKGRMLSSINKIKDPYAKLFLTKVLKS